VHMALFGDCVGFTPAQRTALVHGAANDACWQDDTERDLIAFCDVLNKDATVSDATWNTLRQSMSELAMLEIVMLCGYYRTVSYLTNSLKMPNETFGVRFPAK
jgi:alkylhydroperoxidase family enzyme